MTHDTFLIILVTLIAGPFLLSCIKGNPHIGVIGGVASVMLMGFLVTMGMSRFESLFGGVIVAGVTLYYSFNDD